MATPLDHTPSNDRVATPAAAANFAASQHSFADAYDLPKPKATQPEVRLAADTTATDKAKESPATTAAGGQEHGHLHVKPVYLSPETARPAVPGSAPAPEKSQEPARPGEAAKPRAPETPEAAKPKPPEAPESAKPKPAETPETKPKPPEVKTSPTPGYPLPDLTLVDHKDKQFHSLKPGQCVEGEASHYGQGDGLYGRKTASGERLKPGVPTVAVPNYDHQHESPYKVVVYNPANGKSVDARVNDMGPHVRLGRVADIESKTFKKIVSGSGLAHLRVCRPEE